MQYQTRTALVMTNERKLICGSTSCSIRQLRCHYATVLLSHITDLARPFVRLFIYYRTYRAHKA